MATTAKENRYFVYFGYAVMFIVAFFVQTTPFMFKIGGVYPNLLLTLLIIVSFFENDFVCSVLGLFAGLLADIGAANGEGLHALTYMITGLACSLLVEILIQNNLISTLALAIPVFLLHSIIQTVTISTVTAGFTDIFVFYVKSSIYSIVVMLPLYLVFRYGFFAKRFPGKPTGIIPKKSLKKIKAEKGQVK